MTDQEYAWRSERDRNRELLAEWMGNHGFATGHGDTLEELLKELAWQVAELRRVREAAEILPTPGASRLPSTASRKSPQN